MKKKILINLEVYSVSNKIFNDFVRYSKGAVFSYDLDSLIEVIKEKYKPILILDYK